MSGVRAYVRGVCMCTRLCAFARVWMCVCVYYIGVSLQCECMRKSVSLSPAPQINKKSGAILAVRGQYMPALEKEQALQRGYVCQSLCAVHLWTPSLSTCISSVCCEVTLSSSATCYREKALHIHIQAPQQSNVDCKCVCVCV